MQIRTLQYRINVGVTNKRGGHPNPKNLISVEVQINVGVHNLFVEHTENRTMTGNGVCKGNTKTILVSVSNKTLKSEIYTKDT
jgi:hypothetical protein